MHSKYGVLFWIALAALPCVAEQKVDDGLRQALNQALYRLDVGGHGAWRGENPDQRLSIAFDTRAARFQHALGNVSFRLRSLGYGDGLCSVTEVEPVANGNRVEYRRGELIEWYENTAAGIEQGFTLSRRPITARQDDPLLIALTLEGNLTPVLSPAGDAVLLGSALRYGGLQSWDARGRAIPSRLQVRERQVSLVIDDRDAHYPLTVDPIVNQQAELVASDGAKNDGFGSSVSVSGDTAVVGALGKNGQAGAVYVFVRSGGVWTQQQELTASDATGDDWFGESVSVSGDTIVIGAPLKSNIPPLNLNQQGVAYVFVRSGGVWTQQQELIASDAAIIDNFGWSVSVSGNIAVIGALRKSARGMFSGAAYVLVRSGSTWTQQQELIPFDGAAADEFGTSVALSGNTVVIGAPQKNNHRGTAYVFVTSGPSGTWTQQQELTASDGAALDQFGVFVAVDADTALIGAWAKNNQKGAAYIFTRNGSPPTWTEHQELTASDGVANDLFGYSPSLSGSTAVIGAPGRGAAYLFVRNGGASSGIWTQQQTLTISDGTAIGNSAAVSGATVVVGAQNAMVGTLVQSGAAYVFVTISGVSVTPNSGSGLGPVTFSAVYRDPNGASDLQVAYLDFANLPGATHSCFAIYIPGGNALYLYNDTNSALLGPVTPGTPNAVSNSQCTLSGAGGAVIQAETDLVVPATITFAPGFSGFKNIFGLAQSYSGFNGGWQTLGNWTAVIAPPLGPVSFTPNGGSGLGRQTFTAVFADPNGASDIQVAYVDFSASGGGATHSCFIAYVPSANALYLFGDTNTLLGPITPGTGAALSNSQCTLSGGGGIVTASGSNLTIPLAITFSAAFAGSKGIFASAQNYAGQGGFESLGTWTPTTAALGAQSVNPINGNGFGPLTFNVIYTDPNGASDIQGVYLDFGTGIFAPNSCIVAYTQASNMLALLNDASNGAVGFIMAGGNGTLSNGQCTLTGAGGTIALSGMNLTVPFAITFNTAFTGAKSVFGVAQNNANTFSAWSMLGTWTP